MYSECINKNFTLISSTRLLTEVTAKLLILSFEKLYEILLSSMLNIFVANVLQT